ncbi:hypothetical protein JCM11641_001016 [Rhodosporidiobolus odoratus]
MSGQSPYPPPHIQTSYSLPASTYPPTSSGGPLLSAEPLSAGGVSASSAGFDSYSPYSYQQSHLPQPPRGGPRDPNPFHAYGMPPQLQQQQQQQQSLPGQTLPPPYAHPHAHHLPPQRPPSTLPDPSSSLLARSATPLTHHPHHHPYGPSVVGSPGMNPRQPPTPTQQGPGLNGSGGPGPAAAQASGAAGGQAPTKARSAMACNLCRRQKMKCEGPEKAPCRRCRAAQVDCVFEAPAPAPPRAGRGGATVGAAVATQGERVVERDWVENRLSGLDARLSNLEHTTSSSLTVRQPQPPQVSPALQSNVADHERRIAALEAQLYALQVSVSRPQQPQQFQQHQLPPHQQQPPKPAIFSSSGGGNGMQHIDMTTDSPYSDAAGSSAGPGRAPATAGSTGGAGVKHEDGDFSGGRESKRWKGDPLLVSSHTAAGGEEDFIARGLVSEEEAAMCFESYHFTFAHSTTSLVSPQPHLFFAETRRRSPFFLATVVSIGARSLSRFETFHASYKEAMRLAHLTFLPFADGGEDLSSPSHLDPSSLPSSFIPFVPFGAPGSDAADAPKPRLSTLSLKALMLLALNHSLPELFVHVFMLGYRFVLPTSLLEFEKLTEEEKMSEKGRELINRGRVFLVWYLWTAFYTYARGHAGFFDQPIQVLRQQLDIIRRSKYAEQPTDHVIRVNLEECLILLNAFKQLGPGMRSRAGGLDHAEVYKLVGEAIEQLVEWDKTWQEGMYVLSQWGDSQELKSQVPFAHGRQCLLMYIFRDIPSSEIDLENPQTKEFARMGIESALVILKWGVESRIWMPFSVVGNYVHHVNIPTALFLLSTCARLFPTLPSFPTLRPLLHRLMKQCDVTTSHPGATLREIARAKRTKMEVLALDRFAFEQCDAVGEGVGEMGGESSVGGAGGGAGVGLQAAVGSGGGGESGETGATAGAGIATEDLGGAGIVLDGAAPAGGGIGGIGGGLHGMTGGPGGGRGEEEGLFGQEITASLDSLRLELNLWAKPLRGFEEDL